jgi:hypothetical protein
MLDTTARLHLRARFASNAPSPYTLADLDGLLDDHRDLAIATRRLGHRAQLLDQLTAQLAAYYGGQGLLRDVQRGHGELMARLHSLEAVQLAARNVLGGGSAIHLARALEATLRPCAETSRRSSTSSLP